MFHIIKVVGPALGHAKQDFGQFHTKKSAKHEAKRRYAADGVHRIVTNDSLIVLYSTQKDDAHA